MTDVATRETALSVLRGLEESGILTPTAFKLDKALPFDHYELLGRWLGSVRDTSAWWLADWINFGEGIYGEKYAQAVEATGRSKRTLMNYAYVGRSVARSRRREKLTYSHHVLVAPLEPDEQIRWLKEAEEHGWTVEELGGMIRGDTIDAGDDRPPKGDAETIADRLETAARLVWRQAQRTADGDYRVPPEAMAQLAAALGEQD